MERLKTESIRGNTARGLTLKEGAMPKTTINTPAMEQEAL